MKSTNISLEKGTITVEFTIDDLKVINSAFKEAIASYEAQEEKTWAIFKDPNTSEEAWDQLEEEICVLHKKKNKIKIALASLNGLEVNLAKGKVHLEDYKRYLDSL